MELHPEVTLAIDLAARDVAKAFADHYGRGSDYASLRRSIGGFISMAVAKSAMKEVQVWTDASQVWTKTSADAPAGTIDPKILESATNKWWDAMDPAGQLFAITEHAGHHKSEYVKTIVQKFQGKPISELSEIPELDAAYKAESSAPAAPAPPPAGPASAPVKTQPVIPQP